MKKADFLEILRGGHSFNQGGPLTFQDIQLEVGIEVVDQEAHMLAEKHSLSEVGV